MMTLLETWYQIEIGWIVWLQGWSQLVPFFRWFTDAALNSLPLIPAVVLFFLSWRNGCVLFSIYLLGHCTNMILKLSFGTPRPFWLSDEVVALIGSGSFGMPSGHMLISASVWIGLAVMYPRFWLVLPVVFLTAAMALSRVYLGVHFIVDVVAGIGFATILAWGCSRDRFWNNFLGGRSRRVIVIFGSSLLLVVATACLVWYLVQGRQIPAEWPGNLLGIGALGAVLNGTVGLIGLKVGTVMVSRRADLLEGLTFFSGLLGFVYSVFFYFLVSELEAEFLRSIPGVGGLLLRSLKYGISLWVISYLAIRLFSDLRWRQTSGGAKN